MPRERIVDQLRRNAVALISLVIAITSLGYNTWRNEHTENNRNQRWASFEILLKLGELRELINLNHYDCNPTLRGNPRTGWVIVETVVDLAPVIEEMAPESADKLRNVWAAHSAAIDYNGVEECRNPALRARGDKAIVEIRTAINEVRDDIVSVLHSLT
ncbi:MAG: hypothetical protein R3288_12395 [Woeseiaceae bacterium]|nr:hypothetical protein [Woeseiaceae bacterium]